MRKLHEYTFSKAKLKCAWYQAFTFACYHVCEVRINGNLQKGYYLLFFSSSQQTNLQKSSFPPKSSMKECLVKPSYPRD